MSNKEEANSSSEGRENATGDSELTVASTSAVLLGAYVMLLLIKPADYQSCVLSMKSEASAVTTRESSALLRC